MLERLYLGWSRANLRAGAALTTGEVGWLVSDALHLEVPVPVIALSVMQLFASRDDERLWARAIAMMRHGFGGHPYGPAAAIAEERRSGRIGDAFLESGTRDRSA